MKKNYIWIALGSIALFAACGKSFLEKYPVGQIGKEQLFKEISGLNAALNGAYSLVAKYHMTAFGMLGDVRGDDLILHPANDINLLQEYDYQVDAEMDVSATTNIWRDLFEALNSVNNVINGADGLLETMPGRKHVIDSVKGQALVLRALTNFSLVKAFGQHYTYTADAGHLGIPILYQTPFPGTPVRRESVQAVYAFMIADLEAGIKLMEGKNNTNRVTASIEGAQALLSRLYLYMEKWEAVVDYTNLVFRSNRFRLAESNQYAGMFMDPSQRTGNRHPEVIWQLNLSTMGGNFINNYYSDTLGYRVSPTQRLLDLYDENDVRKSLYQPGKVQNRIQTLKYGAPLGTSVLTWPINYKVIRLSEIYLNRAEAYWHLKNYGNAEADLKVIQARALGKTVEEITLPYQTPEELLELIKTERRKELAFEGHRIYDIVRYKEDMDRGTNCTAVTCKVSYPNNLFVLPIPMLELDANPSMQPNP